MVKTKTLFYCQSCGNASPKWVGQCPSCEEWNTFIEEKPLPAKPRQASWVSDIESKAKLQLLSEVEVSDLMRRPTGISEFDRVLGGGLVPGSVILIGGDPGIGKSTLLLQTTCQLSATMPTLYVTGEESIEQVSLRAKRLELNASDLKLLPETHLETILSLCEREKPKVLVIDSIQTTFTDQLSSAPGTVGQIRESTAQLVRYAKQTDTCIFLVGHVTKEGALAGPRVLEHMVDTVLYFEGQQDSRFRVVRSVKNRFGAVNELGIFAMTDKGLREVSNPSAIFLSRYDKPVAGSIVMVTWEGTRPLLVEVQALVSESHLPQPRRVTVGLEQNRLAMLLAVLQRHAGITSYDQDVFVNVVGGVRITETAADLALLLAIVSSLKNKPLPNDLIVFGEVGLAGEIRPVQSGQERLHEAHKHGFKSAIVPKANLPKTPLPDMAIKAVSHLSECF